MKTLENGFSFVSDLSITNSHIVETISVSSENPSRKYEDIYLFHDVKSKDYKVYSGLEDNTGTFALHRIYLFDQPFDYDAYAVIQPKSIEEMEETNHPRRQMILDVLEENNNNPILLKFK